MMQERKVCPVMSYRHKDLAVVDCMKHKCAFWKSIYNNSVKHKKLLSNCAYVLTPLMMEK